MNSRVCHRTGTRRLHKTIILEGFFMRQSFAFCQLYKHQGISNVYEYRVWYILIDREKIPKSRPQYFRTISIEMNQLLCKNYLVKYGIWVMLSKRFFTHKANIRPEEFTSVVAVHFTYLHCAFWHNVHWISYHTADSLCITVGMRLHYVSYNYIRLAYQRYVYLVWSILTDMSAMKLAKLRTK